jgi:uroporphyrin-III C-methyltransferase
MNASLHTSKLMTKGSVTLVGAGPGDPELLTLKAAKAIAKATVILVDDLVNDEVLCHANSNARIVYVGKRGGCKSTPQAFIEKMMIAEAMAGEVVVRLKGGDPMFFGRAGEELAALNAARVPCTVINGITSGLAAATSLQMPLTHRDYAHGVVFVTGHAAPGGAATNWAELGKTAAELKLTLVIYMGVSQAQLIEQGLSLHMDLVTPVALIQNASSAQEVCFITTLADLTACLERESLASPLVMVIGDVVKVAQIIPKLCVSSVQDGYNARLVA